MWKQPDRIISAGLGLIRKDRRMKLLGHSDGVNLQITNLDIDDAGNYICEVENEGEPILQTNQLQILGKTAADIISALSYSFSSSKDHNFSPRTEPDSQEGFEVQFFLQYWKLKKQIYFSLKLSCNASGFPSPRISWQRQVCKINITFLSSSDAFCVP